MFLGAASQRFEYLALELIGTPWALEILADWKMRERGAIPGPTEICIMIFIISNFCHSSITPPTEPSLNRSNFFDRFNLRRNQVVVCERHSRLSGRPLEYYRFYFEFFLRHMDWLTPHLLVCRSGKCLTIASSIWTIVFN